MLISNHRYCFSPCDLVKSAFIDILIITKPQLCTNFPETVEEMLKDVLFGLCDHNEGVIVQQEPAFNDSPQNDNKCESEESLPHQWTHDSVDLQLSKCRLLLDTQAPVLYCERLLIQLLDDDSMYEVHHKILSVLLDQSGTLRHYHSTYEIRYSTNQVH